MYFRLFYCFAQKESPVGSLTTTPAGLGGSAKLHAAWGHDGGGFRSIIVCW
jgi:hypothetical protein